MVINSIRIQLRPNKSIYKRFANNKYRGLRGLFKDLHNGLPCLNIGLECRAIWHGALVIVWALRGCHVYPNTEVKWLTKNTIKTNNITNDLIRDLVCLNLDLKIHSKTLLSIYCSYGIWFGLERFLVKFVFYITGNGSFLSAYFPYLTREQLDMNTAFWVAT